MYSWHNIFKITNTRLCNELLVSKIVNKLSDAFLNVNKIRIQYL
jgi:hypothetical protein